ncbi:MAG: DUF3526 domain-containing protein [Acidobacteriota bacterium]
MSNPVLRIARKEFTESLRDGRFRALAFAVLMLLAASLAAGWIGAREARRHIAVAETLEEQAWLGQGPKNPHSAAHFGNFAFKPRPTLASLDPGVDAYLGTAVWLEAHRQGPFSLRPAEDATATQRFGDLTAALTLQVLAPLLAIILGFQTFAGERERGTLRLLASLGLEPRTLALGKALGLAAALFLALGPAVALGVTTAAMSGGSSGAGPSLVPGLLLAAVYLVYFATLLALVIAVSARAPSPRAALVTLLGLWMAATLIVPRLAADLAERLYPIPTSRAFFAAIDEDQANGVAGMGSREERRARLEKETLERYGARTLEELPVDFGGLSLQASEEHANLVFDKHYAELWRLYERQERLHLWAALASPTLAVRSVSMALAGTDIERHRHFASAAEDHRRRLVKFLNDDLTYNSGEASFGYLADEALWRSAPEFTYRAPALAATLRDQAPALVLLAAWLLAALLVAGRAVSRLKILPGGAS